MDEFGTRQICNLFQVQFKECTSQATQLNAIHSDISKCGCYLYKRILKQYTQDTHNRTFDIPEGDILIHAGDLTALHDVNYDITARWLLACRIKCKVIVAGNHDIMLLRDGKPRSDGSWDVDYRADYDPQAIDSLCGDVGVTHGLYYLQNNTREVYAGGKTWKILGSPLYPSRRPTKHVSLSQCS